MYTINYMHTYYILHTQPRKSYTILPIYITSYMKEIAGTQR